MLQVKDYRKKKHTQTVLTESHLLKPETQLGLNSIYASHSSASIPNKCTFTSVCLKKKQEKNTLSQKVM